MKHLMLFPWPPLNIVYNISKFRYKRPRLDNSVINKVFLAN